ncbi:phytanoyl-CoA dioxygenase family protein [Streptomyces caniferus]|uniref:phytanoyl-CoA dioxygenase family protein n=1 Tax=Streptomyces caniferus TaxID=285557 RepID=UPI00382DB473
MDEYQKYFFDLNGYLVIEDFLSKETLGQLNGAIDANLDRIRRDEYSLAHGAAAFTGDQQRQEFDDALSWREPWGDAFRSLISHPQAVAYMLALIGDGFRCDTVKGTLMTAGTEGFTLHGGGGNPNSLSFYNVIGDQIRNGLMNISYVLTDVDPGDGGFVCIPGSHKSNFRCPSEVTRMEAGSEYLKPIPTKAGSVVIFTEALVHGTLPWRAQQERRTVFVRYSPGAMSFREDPMPPGYESFRSDLSPLQRAILEPPYYRGRPKIGELLQREADESR